MIDIIKKLFNRKSVFNNLSAGLCPSPEDFRDYPLSGIIPPILRYPEDCPRAFDLTITNQGSNPSCVGHSGGAIKQYLEMKERTFIEPDSEWLYSNCKKIDGMPNVQGTFFRAVLTVLKNIGCKLKGQDNDPSIYRIQEYRKVDDISFESLKKTIFVYGHALAGWRGSNEGWQGEIIRSPRVNESTWGHATTLTHYFRDYLGGQNSWGEERHSKGLFKSSKDYLPFEAWVVVQDAPNEPKEEVRTGWVAITYIDANNITMANLNVRLGAGTNYPILKTLPRGTKVVNFGSANVYVGSHRWTEIIIN